MVKRVYTGPQPTVFMTGGVGRVEPGQRFDVPAGLEEAFDRRRDVAKPGAGGGRKQREDSDSGDSGRDAEPAPDGDSSGGL